MVVYCFCFHGNSILSMRRKCPPIKLIIKSCTMLMRSTTLAHNTTNGAPCDPNLSLQQPQAWYRYFGIIHPRLFTDLKQTSHNETAVNFESKFECSNTKRRKSLTYLVRFLPTGKYLTFWQIVFIYPRF